MTWDSGCVRQGTDRTEKLAWHKSLIPETDDKEKRDRARAAGETMLISVAGATCTAVSVVTRADWRTVLVGYEIAEIDPSRH